MKFHYEITVKEVKEKLLNLPDDGLVLLPLSATEGILWITWTDEDKKDWVDVLECKQPK